MKIELRKVKYAAFASEETHCFSAEVIVDGQPLCTAENDGHGGCDNYHPVKGRTHADIAAVDAHIKEHFPKCELEGHKPMDSCLEIVVGDLLNTWLVERDYKRAVRTKILAAAPDGQVWQWKLRKGAQIEPVIAQIKAKHPDYQVLNTMPLVEALALYRGAA